MLYPVAESCLPAEVLKALNRQTHERGPRRSNPLKLKRCIENLMTFQSHERLCPDVRKENPTSLKYKVNNAKKKTSWIISELTSEEIRKARLAVIGIIRIEPLSELKEKIQWHFSTPSTTWYGGWWERMVLSIKRIS
ncbi:hypothetical protein TNCV_341171 [Trichonephila clavipes]|uniref:Uncharacterized protein n=1 Tax=Trichonephila clavipes TaxID=2585209 RepID=A0A8X6T0C5_TRICX|nr:hypothetical protein TNCV_341171 [Trichonephila clavipes]